MVVRTKGEEEREKKRRRRERAVKVFVLMGKV